MPGGTGMKPGARSGVGLHAERVRRTAVPSPSVLHELYVRQRLSEREIAKALHISPDRIAEGLQAAGIPRRVGTLACPVSAAELRRLHSQERLSDRQLAARFGVASGTVKRWLAEARVVGFPDAVDIAELRRLYSVEQLPIRRIAEVLGCGRDTVQTAVAVAGLDARPSAAARRDARLDAEISDEAIRQAYLKSGLTKKQAAAQLGVSRRYLERRLVAAGLFKRPGAFTAKTVYTRQELRERAAKLYEGGASMQEVADRLGVTISTVRKTLHEAAVPTRRRGYPSSTVDAPRRLLIEDLYADARIVDCLRRHGVVIPGPEVWEPMGPTRTLAPLPLSGELLRELYRDVGLATLHISMLCGVGLSAVRGGLAAADVVLRDRGETSPWLARTQGLAGTRDGGRSGARVFTQARGPR